MDSSDARNPGGKASPGSAETDALAAFERTGGGARVAVPPTTVPAAKVPANVAEATVVLAIAVPPTTVPAAPAPANIAEPTVVLTVPEPRRSGPGYAPSVPEPPPSSPGRVPMGQAAPGHGAQRAHAAPSFGAQPVPARPVVEDAPEWALRTHLPLKREDVRTARRKSSTLVVGAIAGTLTAVAVIAALVLTSGGSNDAQTAGAQTSASSQPSGAASAPAGTAAPPSGVATSTTAASAASAASGSPAATASAAPAAQAPAAAAGTPEADARAALARLRDGIANCVRTVIGVMPGTTPAVPAQMALMKAGAYQSKPRDFRSPVFSCAKYKETEPQRFQIQWQLTPPSEGRGVAWLDDDGDGKADRAFGFRATLVRKNEIDLGEIGPLAPVPPVMKPRP